MRLCVDVGQASKRKTYWCTPDSAAAVAAKALVDQLGRLELRLLDVGAAGLVDTWVSE